MTEMTMTTTDSPADILELLMEPMARCMTTEAAREFVNLCGGEAFQTRMRELAEKSNEGLLTSDERFEYESYVMAADIMAILRAQARTHLASES